MLISLLSTTNYNQFNIELAHIMGLHESIYLNELININEKAIRKNKTVDGFFRVDRDYVTKRTTIKKDEQREIDRILVSFGILSVGKTKEELSIDVEKLASLLLNGNEKVLNLHAKEVKEAKKVAKKELILKRLKDNIVTNNTELYSAYCDWIDSVYGKRGYMDKKAVTEGQKAVDEFSKRNLDVALKVINIATINSYVDMNWAINNYKKDHKMSTIDVPTIQNISQLSTEAF